ncbi:MAG: hypothetical protein IIC61_09550 [Proteobacteria bacterium]|nr:hypothetical protein [Pseudomonadota bacterium]
MEVQAATPPRISSGTNFAQSVPAFQLMFTVVMIILANALAFLTQILPSGQVFFDNDPFERRQPGLLDHVLGWMGTPFAVAVSGPEPSPQALARVSQTSVYFDWNDLTTVDAALTGDCSIGGDPCAVDADCPQVGAGEVCDGPPIHLGDCEIAPGGAAPATTGNTYFIQAINLGTDEAEESSYSSPLRLRTVTRHADVGGTGGGTNFPNQTTGLADAFKIVLGFQGNQTIPKWRLDQTGGQAADNVPNINVISLVDVFEAVKSFQSGGAYGFEQPCDCPGQICP